MNINMLLKCLLRVGMLFSFLLIQVLISPVKLVAATDMNPCFENLLPEFRQNDFPLSYEEGRNDFAVNSKPSHMFGMDLSSKALTA